MSRNRIPPAKRVATPELTLNGVPPKGMYAAVLGFLLLMFFRVHDFIPPLAAIRPFQLLTVAILLLWLKYQPPVLEKDPIIRWQLILLGVMAIGLPVVVNHFWWLNTILDYLMYLIVFSLGLGTVAQHAVFRRNILRVLLFSFMFLAVWALTHSGVGPLNSWVEDENDMAGALVVGTCLAYATQRESPSAKWRWLAFIVGLTCVAGVIATASRGGFVALVASIITIALLSGALIRTTLVMIALVLLAFPFIPKSYIGEVKSIDESAESYGKTGGQEMERLYTWRRSWQMFLANPVIGVGAGNASWNISKFENTYEARLERGRKRNLAGRAIHSIYFTLLPELGILGAIAYFTIITLALKRILQVLKQPEEPREDGSPRMIALFVGPALVGYSTAGVFISVLWYPMLWLLVGLTVVLKSKLPPSPPEPGR